MSRDVTAKVRFGDESGEEAVVKLCVFAPETDASLALRMHHAARPKQPGFPVNLRLSKRDALKLAVKLIEAAADDSGLGTGPRRPGSVSRT